MVARFNSVRVAAPIASTSSTATSGATSPPARISRGPEGQSVATTGVPSASASVKAFGDPSQREASTNSAARATIR